MDTKARRTIETENFSEREGECKCGCGMQLGDKIVLLLQAFVHVVERNVDAEVECIINSGARCPKHNKAEGGATDSRHLHGDAVDVIFRRRNGGVTVQIPNTVIAKLAISSGLFGGVGSIQYQRESRNLVHLDARPGDNVTVW